MSRLFISLYLDEDVSTLIGELLQRRGYVTLTTRDAGHLGADDAEQLAFAARRQLAVLTHNRVDFERLAQEYLETGNRHSGVFIAVRRPPHEIARRLLLLLNQITADEMDNQVLYI